MVSDSLLYFILSLPIFFLEACKDSIINMYYKENLLELYSNCQKLHPCQFGQTYVENCRVKYARLYSLAIFLILMKKSLTVSGFTLLCLNSV